MKLEHISIHIMMMLLFQQLNLEQYSIYMWENDDKFMQICFTHTYVANEDDNMSGLVLYFVTTKTKTMMMITLICNYIQLKRPNK